MHLDILNIFNILITPTPSTWCTLQKENALIKLKTWICPIKIFNFNIDVRTLKFILISERYFTGWYFCKISKDDFTPVLLPTEPLPFPFCSLIHRLFGCRSDLLCIQSLFHFHFLMQEFNCSNPSSLIHLLFRCPSAFNSFCRL